MRHDAPAALPLTGFVLGLLTATGFTAAAGFLAVAILLWRFSARCAIAVAFFALGSAMTSAHDNPAIDQDRFTIVEATIESDWSERDHTSLLRSSHFVANGTAIAEPITFYARFDPPPIHREARLHAEGFLRKTERGSYAMSIKSARLVSYRGTISNFSPAAWNRLTAQRLRKYAQAYPEEIAMIEALVLGRGERLSDDAKKNFRRGGTYHLLVFSGLQIALAAAVIAFALRWVGAPRISDWSLIVFAALAPPFIGATASVSRSSVGIAAYALSRILKRPTSFENLWCVAALARLMLAPGDLTDPAFQLTYAGAGALIFVGKPLARRIRWPAYAIAAEIVITPLTLFHFHQFALGGSVATVVMTPVIFVMLVIGAMFCVFEMTLLLHLITSLNRLCWWINDAASPASGFFAAPAIAALAAGLLCALVAVTGSTGKRRAIAVAVSMLIPIAAAITRHTSQHTVATPRAVFLDVGQGDSILLRSGTHNVLVDGGGRGGDVRFGESVLLPLLADRGVSHVDAVVLSHAHPDHCGGLPAVIEQMHVGEVWLSPRRLRGECAQMMLEAIRERGTPVRIIHERYTAKIGMLSLEAFTASHGFKRAAENNSSIVIRMTAGARSLLLTGDIEREAESDLASRIVRTDVLKVPHHGSRSSTTAALLESASPRIAIISCGLNNWFGHPHPSVLNSLQERGIHTYRTDRNGTVELEFDGAIFCRPEFDTLQ